MVRHCMPLCHPVAMYVEEQAGVLHKFAVKILICYFIFLICDFIFSYLLFHFKGFLFVISFFLICDFILRDSYL